VHSCVWNVFCKEVFAHCVRCNQVVRLNLVWVVIGLCNSICWRNWVQWNDMISETSIRGFGLFVQD
jgi:hypothetical protein